MRYLVAASVALALAAPLPAQEPALAGTWKLSFLEKDRLHTFWLVKLDAKDGKLGGSVETVQMGIPKTTLQGVKKAGDLFHLSMKLPNGIAFEFEGKLPPADKKIYGSFRRVGNPPTPAVLEATTAKDRAGIEKEQVLRAPGEPTSFALALDLLGGAKAAGLSAKDVAAVVAATRKGAEKYGPRWQAQYTVRVLEALQDQPEYKELALDLAKDVPAADRLGVLSALAAALRDAKQLDEAKALEQQVDQLETAAYAEHRKHGFEFKVDKAARKGAGTRAVLVELFTGAQCPPCVAADIAFDAVEQAYAPKDVVLLQYHVHIPGPDALTTPASEARFEHYAAKFGDDVGGTPAILFNGKPAAGGGGGPDDAAEKFAEYRGVLDKLLAQPGNVRIDARATRAGDKITVKATVKDVDKPGDKVRLRFALVEDWARYKGRNGTLYHHRVVRAMPGGVKGFAVAKAETEASATVDLTELRQELTKFLATTKLPDTQRPMRLRDLHVVAFVQNDATFEVLQAVDVPVE
jgi:hypothetical protein